MAGQASKASLEFGEDVKKRLRLLSEERLTPREEKTCVFVPPFFWQKKWRLEIFISTLHSEMPFEAETSEFCCEIKF